MSYCYDDDDYDDDHDDPEIADAENNHGQPVEAKDISIEEVLGKPPIPPVPNSDYYRGITPTLCSCKKAWIYQNLGYWYEYNCGVAHTCSYAPKPFAKEPFAKERTMNNTIKLTQFPKRGISADSMKIGEYARIISSGHIVLKTTAGVIDLSDPATVWTDPFSSPEVEQLRTGDKLEITVSMNTEFEKDIAHIGRSNKISAIKAVREATNWGLKEAKEYVEALLLRF